MFAIDGKKWFKFVAMQQNSATFNLPRKDNEWYSGEFP